jgi:hypothetical protein
VGGIDAIRIRVVPALVAAALAAGLVFVSFGIGRAVAQEQLALAGLVALLPGLILVFALLAGPHRVFLVYAALALAIWPGGVAGKELGLGGLIVTVPDILVLFALGSWIAALLLKSPDDPVPTPRSLVVGVPLVLLALGIGQALIRGHDAYGVSLVGQPLRIVLYAGIAVAMVGVTAERLFRGLVWVFYVGTVWQTLYALYLMATGGSQTDALYLSSGGTRVLALSTAMYLAGALVLALLSLELETRPGLRILHFGVAVCALFSVIVAYGRVTYASLGLVLLLLLVTRRRLRAALASFIPVLAPAVVIAALLVPVFAPDLFPTLVSRITSPLQEDTSYQWREQAFSQTLQGVQGQQLEGAGFGQTTRFSTMSGTAVIQLSQDPHNSYLYLLSGGGLLTLAAYLLLILAAFVEAWRRFRSAATERERALIIWAAATLFIFLINALAEPVLTDPRLVLTIWALMLISAVVPLRKVASSKEAPAVQAGPLPVRPQPVAPVEGVWPRLRSSR